MPLRWSARSLIPKRSRWGRLAQGNWNLADILKNTLKLLIIPVKNKSEKNVQKNVIFMFSVPKRHTKQI